MYLQRKTSLSNECDVFRNSDVSPMCRICNAAEETISHCQRIQSACSDGVQKQTGQIGQGDPVGFVYKVRCRGAIEVV